MAITKCVMIFKLTTNLSGASSAGSRVAGWSELWYVDKPTLPEAQAVFNRVCETRAALLPRGAQIAGQRYQVVNGASLTGKQRFNGGSGLPCAQPQKSLLVEVRSGTTGNIRHFTLRGIPDAWGVEGEFTATGAFWRDFETFARAIALGGFLFRGRDLVADTVRVGDITNRVLTTTAALPTVNVGDYIQLRRTYNASNKLVSGIFQVEDLTDDSHFTLRGFPSTSVVTLNGFANKYEIIYPPATGAFQVVRLVSRKVGRPTDQYVGRTTSNR